MPSATGLKVRLRSYRRLLFWSINLKGCFITELLWNLFLAEALGFVLCFFNEFFWEFFWENWDMGVMRSGVVWSNSARVIFLSPVGLSEMIMLLLLFFNPYILSFFGLSPFCYCLHSNGSVVYLK